MYEPNEYQSSLHRLYRLLGRAETYSAIAAAMISEIPQATGYSTVSLGIMCEDDQCFQMLAFEGSDLELEQIREPLHEMGGKYRADTRTETFIRIPITEDPMMQELVEGTHIVVVDDARTDPRTNKEVVNAIQNRTIINVPLMLADVMQGSLFLGTFGDEGVRPPTQAHLDYLTALANHVAVAVDRVRFLEGRREAEKALLAYSERLERLLKSTISTMGKIVEARDPYTQGHEVAVAGIAKTIAAEMDLPEDDCEGIEIAALVHDIGKLTVPVEILTKPGTLSDIEFELIKNHSRVGCEILGEIDFGWPVADVVLQHHERMDGSGYPAGLAGDQIMMAARIVAVADVVDAMASHRPYRPAFGLDAAVAEITGHPEKYDPQVTDALVRLQESGRLHVESTPLGAR